MENEQQPTADLELGTEANPPMNQQSEKSDSLNEQSLSDYFLRVLSDGQTRAESDNSVNNEVESADAEDDIDPEYEETETTEEVEETEVEEAVAEEVEADTEEEEVEEYAQSAETPKGVKKRLAKLTALRREAEAKARQLEEEVETLRRSQANPQSPNPYRNLDSEDKIKAEFERQRQIRLFCERYPDGFYEGNTENDNVSKEEIAKAKVVALRALEEHLPRQAEFIVAQKQFKDKARKEFPWLNDPSDKRASMAKRFIAAVPEIKKFPDYEIYAAQLALGMSTYQEQKKNARSGVQQEQRAPFQPSLMSSAPKASVKIDEREAKESYSRFRQSGSIDDLAAVFRSKFV
jgi:hypothetical protein